MIGIVAKLKIKEGKEQEFETVFKSLAEKVRANEPGNNFYELHKDRNDPQTYVVLEQYKDEEAVEAHRNSEHFKAAGPKLGPCMDGAPNVEMFDSV